MAAAHTIASGPDGGSVEAETVNGSKHDGRRSGIEGLIAAEISAIGQYYDRVIEWRGYDARAGEAASSLTLRVGEEVKRRTLIVVEVRGEGVEIAECLAELAPVVARTMRVAVVTRGPLARGRTRFNRREGRRDDMAGTRNVVFHSAKERSFAERKTTITREWQAVRTRPVGYLPWRWAGVGDWFNRALAGLPLIRWACRATVTIWRPTVPEPRGLKPSLSIVVPARNERGNISHVLERLPDFGGAEIEVIFVEGHSADGTWEEIERVASARERSAETNRDLLTVRALRQTGRGKADAVRLGFAQAKGELLTILDADLTTPPESLAQFYEAYCDGRADFINGDRLTLPMERGAMRVLNRWGNRFFAWAVGRVLDTRLGDCLCGTKLLARHDWEQFVAWRERFGDRDPFGDFDLLFPAAALAIGIVDLPVRYGARTYGATNIHRFRDGWRLARMTWAAWWRIRAGAGETGRAGAGE